jgi:cysteinyl-tRNA synthetase
VANPPQAADGPPPGVSELAARRQEARERLDWAAADVLRAEIAALGWQVQDTPDGPKLVRAA